MNMGHSEPDRSSFKTTEPTLEPGLQPSVAPMHILVVDDEPSSRQHCVEVAVLCGMKAHAASSAEEALELMEQLPVDVLITDLKLPQAGGLDLLKRVRDMHPQVAVVVLTQYGTINSAVEAMRLGAVDYVTKPRRIASTAELIVPYRRCVLAL